MKNSATFCNFRIEVEEGRQQSHPTIPWANASHWHQPSTVANALWSMFVPA